MEVTLVREHANGSATYQFDMSDDERLQLLNLGIITALKRGIEEGRKFDDSTVSMGDTGCGTVGSEDGSGEQSSKSEQYELFPETLKVSDPK